MKKVFNSAYPLIGTKHMPAAANLQQRSPYYYWHAYLKRNAEYLECCANGGTGRLAELYKDFGDVRSASFREWWGGKERRGGKLFGETPQVGIQRLSSKDEWQAAWGSDTVVIAVNMNEARRKLQKQFATLLQTVPAKKGRKSQRALLNTSTAKYKLYRNYTTHNLKVMLAVYDAWLENQQLPKQNRLTNWELGEKLKLVQSAMPEKHDNDYDVIDKHNLMSGTVSRMVSRARLIIANTANGEFPNSDKPTSI